MGVSGCGKTLIGKKLAKEFSCQFIEGDDYHSAENKEKMERGMGLDDKDRQGWLIALRDCLSESSGLAVLSCSALKDHTEIFLAKTPIKQCLFILSSIKKYLNKDLNLAEVIF